MIKTEETKEPSESPATFLSLPDDIVFNCLARVSTFSRPTLSLVSKDFRSFNASPELEATRSRNGITEDYLYVCLDLNKNNPNPNPNPSWFTVSRVPKQLKLKPIPSLPFQHPEASTVVSLGLEIYIIGGLVNGIRSSRVFLLDSQSHQWRFLPNMRQPRVTAAADVINGKIYVVGGCMSKNIQDWGEIYDPKTQTWEPMLPPIYLATQRTVVPGKLVMGGKVYDLITDSILNLNTNNCFVENAFRLMSYSHHSLFWNDPKEDLVWRFVQGLEQLSKYPNFFNPHNSLAYSGRGRRVTVWWKSLVIHSRDHHCTEKCKTEIWCAEISFARRGLKELWGSVEWAESVFTFDGCDPSSDFLLHSAIVTH
ncbi:putative F-box/kelch-repeat protein [Cardamine amara subsp. amara]|uniref:F-box/kelch-repeat protein n=1 Tax=Cardamine amara subsp. amara TaxID=228776 RepID=A0ABD0ZST2_CARAN